VLYTTAWESGGVHKRGLNEQCESWLPVIGTEGVLGAIATDGVTVGATEGDVAFPLPPTAKEPNARKDKTAARKHRKRPFIGSERI